MAEFETNIPKNPEKGASEEVILPSSDFSAAAQRSQERKKNETEDHQKDEKRADRLIESPDLNEAVNRLGKQVLSIKKLLDGSEHERRANDEKNSVIKISELQKEIDVLNSQMKDLRDQGKKFRAVDLWSAVLHLNIAPDAIYLNFPPCPEKNYKEYGNEFENGALYSAQSMHVGIEKDAIRIIDGKREKKPPTTNIDTMLFNLAATGKIDEALAMLFRTGGNKKEYWSNTVLQRIKEYGFPVKIHDRSNETYARSYALSIDLQAIQWKTSERYLRIDTEEVFNAYRAKEVYLTNKEPSYFK